jgi:hypothetical protein
LDDEHPTSNAATTATVPTIALMRETLAGSRAIRGLRSVSCSCSVMRKTFVAAAALVIDAGGQVHYRLAGTRQTVDFGA